MTLSPDDLAAMGRAHRESPPTVALRYCTRCGPGFPWPCDSRRLLDEVEALREIGQKDYDDMSRFQARFIDADQALRRIWHKKHIPPCDETVWDYCACLYNTAAAALGIDPESEEVMTQTANEPST